jgi:signal transduction histidine kinase
MVSMGSFIRRACRELLFCLLEVPIGLSGLAALIALATLPLGVNLASGGRASAPSHAQPVALLPVLAGLLIILLAVITLTPWAARRIGGLQRYLAAQLLDKSIADPPRVRLQGGPLPRIGALLRDGPGWKAAAYLLVKLPVTIGEGLAVFLAVIGPVNMTYPFWWNLFRNHPAGARLRPVVALTPFGALHIETFPGTFAAFAAGLAMLLAAPWLARATASADCWLMLGMLGPGRLAQRVADLERTRAMAVEDSAALMRRLERDLHDGAQIRLATLAMNLGMAREKLSTDADPVARELVDTAHRQAKDALVELRNLARGMHPAALDNGLQDALATLVAASAVPVELTIALRARPDPAIESIAYFCAAELLANIVKHSQANRAALEVTMRAGRLRLRVSDDGRGGADPDRGAGLAGLRQRVSTVDGRMQVRSPAGGPTEVTITLPMHA